MSYLPKDTYPSVSGEILDNLTVFRQIIQPFNVSVSMPLPLETTLQNNLDKLIKVFYRVNYEIPASILYDFLDIQKELFKRQDFYDLITVVCDVVYFVRKQGYDFRGELKCVQDAEIPDWEEVVLTLYVKASVEDVLELWNKLYEHVDIRKIVVAMQPAAEHE